MANRSKKWIVGAVIMIACYLVGLIFTVLAFQARRNVKAYEAELAALKAGAAQSDEAVQSPWDSLPDDPWDSFASDWTSNFEQNAAENRLNFEINSSRHHMDFLIYGAFVFFAAGTIGGGIMFSLARNTDARAAGKTTEKTAQQQPGMRGMMYCMECGAVLPVGAKFCKHCGSAQQ